MSAIDTSKIDTSYPVPGQDNDSQGFRTNFTNIRDALDTAKAELDAFNGLGFVIDADDTVPAGWTGTGHYISVENLDGDPLVSTRYQIITKDS